MRLVPTATATSLACAAALLTATPSAATEVRLTGAVINSCVLSLPTNGALALSTDGTQLGSQEGVGGAPASLTIVAAGAAPTLNFSSPTLTGPAGLSGATTAYAFTSTGSGANQAYTTGPSTATSSLVDSFSINSRVTSASGFPSGNYTVAVTITCQQS